MTIEQAIADAVREAITTEFGAITERLDKIEKRLEEIVMDTTRVTVSDLDDLRTSVDGLTTQIEQSDRDRVLAESRAELRQARLEGRAA